jgi:carbon monoxide dehydrogenase subunit G
MLLNYKINKPADLVFDCLTNMTRFVSVHPVINKVNYLGHDNYRIFETLKLGLIPISFTYPAVIESDYESKQVVMKAVVMKVAFIEMGFTITENNGYSIVEEEIKFKSVLPIKSIMQQVIVKQHALLFKNIENTIE